MDNHHHLHHPLLPTTTATATATTPTPNSNIKAFISSNSDIILRILSIILIVIISTWANNEASKGFNVTTINDANPSLARLRFQTFYASTDETARLVQKSSDFATKILFPNTSNMPKSHINHVIIHLSSQNLTDNQLVLTHNSNQNHVYIISISPSVLESSDFKYEMRKTIQRGMSQIWLQNDAKSNVPNTLVDGMVEYISIMGGFGTKMKYKKGENNSKCWENKYSKFVAHFLEYSEKKIEGFIGKLNEEGGWDEKLMDKHLCRSFMMENAR